MIEEAGYCKDWMNCRCDGATPETRQACPQWVRTPPISTEKQREWNATLDATRDLRNAVIEECAKAVDNLSLQHGLKAASPRIAAVLRALKRPRP
jgi:hypothetical protein